MTSRRLSLKREPLTELTADQLGAVDAGSGPCTALSGELDCEWFTQPIAYCLTVAGPRCIF